MTKKRCKYCYTRTADKTLGKGDLCPDCYEYQRQEELLTKIQFADGRGTTTAIASEQIDRGDAVHWDEKGHAKKSR